MTLGRTKVTWPAGSRPFTIAELDRLPDDGRRYAPALIYLNRKKTAYERFGVPSRRWALMGRS